MVSRYPIMGGSSPAQHTYLVRHHEMFQRDNVHVLGQLEHQLRGKKPHGEHDYE